MTASTIHRLRRVAATLLAGGLLAGGLVAVAVPAQADTAPATGTPATVSADALPTWQINGVVWSQVLVGNTVYATGSFSKARPPGVAVGGPGEIDAQNIFAYDIRTGNPVSGFSHSLNAQGLVITASPDGSRVYVGGDFTSVDGVVRGHVAAFNVATGALDANFAPNVSNTVKALAASASTLYIGGGYGAVNGTTRPNLSAVSSASGALQAWNPKAENGTVWSMVLAPDGSRVIVGGSFTILGGVAAYGMGSISTSNASILPWAANQTIRSAGKEGAITSLRTDGSQIFGTGYSFDTATANFEGTFAADPSTGQISTVNDCHGDSYDILPLGQVMYNVGHVHECTAIGSFPDTNPRVRWQHALAWTIAPTTKNVGPDSYGWNFDGQPASSLLQWFPSITAGTFTGQGQAGWSLAGNSDYIVIGGEFPKVNGVAQQGLTRMARTGLATNKRGPSYTTNPARTVPATTAISFASGSARVGFGTAWDYDNESLTYDVFRDGGATPVYTSSIKSNFWTLPTGGFTDTGLAPGSTHTYQIRISDPSGNTIWSPKSNVVTISAGSQSAYAQTVSGDGASHFWRLGEPSGSTAYDWAGFDDVTLTGNVTRGDTGAVNGDTDAATVFDGNSSGADPSAIVGPDTFTEEAWVRTTSTSGGKIIGFGNAQNGNSSAYDRHIYMDSEGRFIFGVYNNGVYTATSKPGFNDGQYHQVVGTLDSTGMTLYVDGKKVARNTGTTAGQAYTGYWRIGGDNLGGWPNGNAGYFTGTIDDVAVYPSSLTADQVLKHYTDSGRTLVIPAKPTDSYGKAVYNSAPDFFWRLGETTGSTAKDVTMNQADGLYSGGVTRGTSGAVTGTTDTAVTLDGSDGAVAASGAVSNPSVYSEELWFNTTTNRGGKLIGFGSSQTGLSGSYDRHVYMFDDGRLRFGVWTGQTNVIDTDKAYNDGQWHHMVATQGPDGMKLYVDGILTGTNGQTQAQPYDGYWRVGGDNAWGGNSSPYFAGAIDEVAVYSSALSASTVQAHFRAGGGTLPNVKPTAAFSSTAADLKASFDGSQSADTDGTVDSYSWDFGDNTTTGTGAKPDHTYSAAGTYTVKLTVTDDAGAADSVSRDVTVTAPSPVVAADAFNRSLTNGWGTADTGGAWTVGSTTSNYGVAAGAGTMKTSLSSGPSAYLNGVSARDVDLTTSFGYDKAGTGGGIYTALIARRNGTSDYRAKVISTATATTLYLTRTVNGTETVLATQAISGMVYAPGDVLNVRLQAEGSGTTTLRAKIWKTGTTEPSTWRVTTTDTTAALQTAGSVGISNYLSGSATNGPVTLSVLDLAVQKLG